MSSGVNHTVIEKQMQWILSYIQRGSVDTWKKNFLEDLESEEVEFGLAEEFLLEFRKKFEGEDKESVKVVELRRIK